MHCGLLGILTVYICSYVTSHLGSEYNTVVSCSHFAHYFDIEL